MQMPESVADSATAAVRKLLARGRYAPGDRLPPERELAAGLGVSRPTLREAIRRLTEAGLLESRQGSGTYVAGVDLSAVYAVRLQLEPYAAGRAAVERTSDDARRLGALVRVLGERLDEPERFAATDREIHRELALMSANPVLADQLERLTELAELSRAITAPEREARVATLRTMRALARAVRRRDPEAARGAMGSHISTLAELAARFGPADRVITAVAADAS
jgi:GntR family transcriptional regulator, transcriptional repressor for pyruvate dehydrogenase complex